MLRAVIILCEAEFEKANFFQVEGVLDLCMLLDMYLLVIYLLDCIYLVRECLVYTCLKFPVSVRTRVVNWLYLLARRPSQGSSQDFCLSKVG